ncbi:protein translocase subunit SecF [Patescibacteria group bacterium]|nr:protein translocase subunit SecF [Patescibacteria group bacterium]
MIDFLKYRIIFFIFSGILIVASIGSLFIFGLQPGIEFTGGTLIDISYNNQRPTIDNLKKTLSEFDFKEIEIKLIGGKNINLRISEKNITNDLQQKISDKLKTLGEVEDGSLSFETISPVIGKELRAKTQIITILSILVIVLYIAIAFGRVARPISSWQYGVASLLTLSQDVLITLGVFSILGKFYGVQVTIPVVTALLVIVGYAINDKIVVFDRIRENLLRKSSSNYDEIVNVSLNQILSRCLSTSLTTLFPLFAIFFLGGQSLKYFSLALIIGIIIGTYSSLFIASQILVSWLKRKEKRAVK